MSIYSSSSTDNMSFSGMLVNNGLCTEGGNDESMFFTHYVKMQDILMQLDIVM